VWSTDVYGYDLLAVGDPSTDGYDIDYPIQNYSKRYSRRTGYLNNIDEPNPYNTSSSTRAPRTQPDGVQDFYIIHLSSSLDAKTQGTL
jgi:hypothetical protein